MAPTDEFSNSAALSPIARRGKIQPVCVCKAIPNNKDFMLRHWCGRKIAIVSRRLLEAVPVESILFVCYVLPAPLSEGLSDGLIVQFSSSYFFGLAYVARRYLRLRTLGENFLDLSNAPHFSRQMQ
jgi:hypothetical protein